MIRRVRLFVAAHVAVVAALYALALWIGGGWGDPSGVTDALRPDGLTGHRLPAVPVVTRPAVTEAAERLPRHELELRATSQDLPPPWAR